LRVVCCVYKVLAAAEKAAACDAARDTDELIISLFYCFNAFVSFMFFNVFLCLYWRQRKKRRRATEQEMQVHLYTALLCVRCDCD
jgi:hypothetical protein